MQNQTLFYLTFLVCVCQAFVWQYLYFRASFYIATSPDDSPGVAVWNYAPLSNPGPWTALRQSTHSTPPPAKCLKQSSPQYIINAPQRPALMEPAQCASFFPFLLFFISWAQKMMWKHFQLVTAVTSERRSLSAPWLFARCLEPLSLELYFWSYAVLAFFSGARRHPTGTAHGLGLHNTKQDSYPTVRGPLIGDRETQGVSPSHGSPVLKSGEKADYSWTRHRPKQQCLWEEMGGIYK